MTRFLLTISIGLFFLASNAIGQESAQIDFSELKREFTSTPVTKVIDATTFLGKDGTIYQLAGLDVPEPIQNETRKILAGLIEGKEVRLYVTKSQDKGRLNRMGHSIAHVQLREGDVWVEGALLESGLARVRTTSTNPEMAKQLYASEEKARAAKHGIWANHDTAVLSPDDASTKLNSFQIIEGKVKTVAVLTNKIYVNFGADWKKDFTIGIDTNARRTLARAQMDPQQWTGKNIRIRGWVENYNGPYITLDHPQQIEFLDQNATLKASNPAQQKLHTMGYVKTPEAPKVETPSVETPKVEAPEVKPVGTNAE